jgi:rubrerythrin
MEMTQALLDFSKKKDPVIRCPYCGTMYLRKDESCPYCGEENLEREESE